MTQIIYVCLHCKKGIVETINRDDPGEEEECDYCGSIVEDFDKETVQISIEFDLLWNGDAPNMINFKTKVKNA